MCGLTWLILQPVPVHALSTKLLQSFESIDVRMLSGTPIGKLSKYATSSSRVSCSRASKRASSSSKYCGGFADNSCLVAGLDARPGILQEILLARASHNRQASVSLSRSSAVAACLRSLLRRCSPAPHKQLAHLLVTRESLFVGR